MSGSDTYPETRPVTLVRGYLLNLFEMTDRQKVVDNIVNPLVRSEQALDKLLAVTRYAFPDQQGTL